MKLPEFCENVGLTADGKILTFVGRDVTELAAKYGTPVYLTDENLIRKNCRVYLGAVKEAFGCGGRVLYASKAASFKRIYEIMKEEGMGIDVVSSGEIRTAVAAGYPLEKAFFHSNNKTDADVSYAMDCGVGYFVADNEEELYAVEREAKDRNRIQKVLLRLTPGIDPHTYAAISTGKVDSKFGSAIETGQAEDIAGLAMALPHIKLCGFHCHVGSQVFDSDVYIAAAEVMLAFAADIKSKTGFETEILDIGGGYGVPYTENQPRIDIRANILSVGEFMKKKARELGISLPEVCFEPGRSIAAAAGMTLYTAGTVKRIPGYKTYVSVDGGMTDNIRHALYGAPYTLLPANKMDEGADMTCSVVGRCCESGDVIQEGVPMPSSVGRGDIIACLTTGAYHYSMASNYNRIPRPPVVMISGDADYLAVRRETIDDIVSLDL